VAVPRSSSLLQRGRPRPGPAPPPYSLNPLGAVPLPPSLEGGVTQGLAAWERAQSLCLRCPKPQLSPPPPVLTHS
jgi:hypothetical protein